MSNCTLSDNNFKLLKQIMTNSEENLLKSLPIVFEHYYNKDKIIYNQNYIYILGDIPVTLIAHLDTVHRLLPQKFYHDVEQTTIWSPQGLGADDRAGIFSILKIVEAGYRPSIIFTTKEESGAIGAYNFIREISEPKVPTNFLIELDRCGENDAVYYDLDVPEFEKYITTFDFKTAYGSFSDISIIAPGWKIPAVNLSVGYMYEHSLGEILNYENMFDTIEKVKKILDAEIAESHIFPYNISTHSYYSLSPLSLEIDREYNKSTSYICSGCGEFVEPDRLTQIKENNEIYLLCPECMSTYELK